MPTPESPTTLPSLAADFKALGVEPGMVLIVHSSLKAVGWVNGGAVAVILALEEVLGVEGTLVMPTFTSELSDPANWVNPPVPESWWETIRTTMPAYDAAMTPTQWMGAVPETFRKQPGVIRSSNPEASFAAWGQHAGALLADHALTPAFGERSPLSRIYDLGGWVLLLGVGHGNNSSLHLAEWRANIPRKRVHCGSPMMVDGIRQWVAYDDIDWDADDFEALGADFARATEFQKEGKVGQADALLMPQRPLVDYGVEWLARHRG